MKKTPIAKIVAALAAFILILSQTGCRMQLKQAQSALPFTATDWLLNTVCTVTIYEASDGAFEDESPESLADAAFKEARRLEALLSKTVKDSDIYRFNESENGCAVCEETAELVKLALGHRETEPKFDVTSGALTGLWNFTSPEPKVPADEDIRKALRCCCAEISVTKQSDSSYFLEKKDPEVMLDLGSIAKGYIAGRAKDTLNELGVTSAIVNFGGNVVLLGSKPDASPWQVAVAAADRESSSIAGVIEASGGSVVTSGTYERCFTENGELYHHILDPFTGYPAETDIKSVTVTGDSSADCDALSTICLLKGSSEALGLIEGLDGFECLIITGSGEIIKSSGMKYEGEK